MFSPRFENGLAALLLLLGAVVYAHPAQHHVDKSHPRASDSNPGTKESPWLTIQKSAATLKPGDTCWIHPGTYDERIKVTGSDTNGGFRTFKAVGQVIVRGFQLEACSHIRLIGFEITQTASHLYPAIEMAGADYCQILDNDIHHTATIGIFFLKRAPSHHNIVRGNRMSFIGSLPGREIGEIAILIAGNSNVVEYNDISRVADFLNVWGEKNIIRSNYFHDNDLADFPDFLARNPEGHHIDVLQYYSDSVSPLSRTLMEDNLISDNDVPHAHLVLMRNVYQHPSSEFLFRRNVAVRNGAIAILIEAFPSMRIVHNTFIDMLNQQDPKGRYCFQITRGSTGTKIMNNILINSVHPQGMGFYVDETSRPGYQAEGNLIERAGQPAQKRGITRSTQFLAPAAGEFGLSERSPAVDSGSALTLTASAGQGTRVPVADAGYFTDGWGISEGDSIRIGGQPAARIVRVDYGANLIEIDKPLAWTANAPVSYDYGGKAPDIGALERREGTSEGEIRIAAPVSGLAIHSPVSVRAEVPDEADVRYVVFLVDGIPVRQIGQSPFEFTWAPDKVERGPHEIEARAYLRHAGPSPIRRAKISLVAGPSVL